MFIETLRNGNRNNEVRIETILCFFGVEKVQLFFIIEVFSSLCSYSMEWSNCSTQSMRQIFADRGNFLCLNNKPIR